MRLFVALELPAGVREGLAAWRSELADRAGGLRLIRPEDLHVTLCFLGWRSMAELREIREACAVVAGEPAAPLRVVGELWLPPRRPRVLAVELVDVAGVLERVQAALSRTLEAGGWYVPEKRRFLAHVTVARVAGRLPAVSARAAPSPPAVEFEGSRVRLYRSRLSPAGARYEPLGTVELGGG